MGVVAPAVVLVVALDLAATVLAIDDDPVGTVVSQVLLIVTLTVMVAGFLVGAARTSGDTRRAWHWFAAGGIVYLAGELAWGAQAALSGEPDGAAVADALWLAAYPLYFVALQVRSREIERARGRGEGLLESLIVIGVFAIVLWVLGHDAPGGGLGESVGDVAIAIAYPVGGLALLWLLLRNVYGSNARWSLERSLLAIGLVALIVGDLLWSWPGTESVAAYADPLYVLSALALGGAGFAAGRRSPAASTAASSPRPLVVELMPYVAGVAIALIPIWQIASGNDNLEVALGAAAVLILVFVRLAMAVRQNRRMRERAEQAALRDGLTGLWNHRYFQERLGEEIERATRAEDTVGLLTIDIDHFKLVNDGAGHLAGDRLLRELGELLRATSRPSDTPCRIGGDELAVIVPGVSRETMRSVGERILEAATEIRIASGDVVARGFLEVSLSIGASLFPSDATTPGALAENADVALYASKRAGRGRLTVFDAALAGPAGPAEELVAVEERARERERDFRTMFEFVHDSFLILSASGSILDANPAAGALTGLSHRQLRERSIFDLVPEAARAELERIIHEESSSGHEEGEIVIHPPGADPRTIAFNATAFSPDRHLVVLRDVTDRIDAVRTAAEREAIYRAVLDTIDEGVLLLDADGEIRSSNPAAAAILGITEQELTGNSPLDRRWDIVDEHERRLLSEESPSLDDLSGGEDLSGAVFGIRRPAGTRVWIEVDTQTLEPQVATEKPLVLVSLRPHDRGPQHPPDRRRDPAAYGDRRLERAPGRGG